MVQDITERKNAEKALQESEEKFRSVAETAKDAIVSADSKGQITYFNRGAGQIFGYSPSEVFGKPLTILMPEQFHEPHFHGFSRFMQTSKSNIIGKTVEIIGKKKNGDEFPVELSLANWFIGNDIYFTAIIRDITERKNIDQRKDDFITIAGHELRTPLSAIRIINQILQGMFTDNPQALKYLAKIERQSEIEANLIDDLLNVSKIQTGKLEIHKEEFELRSLIEDVAETMQKTTQKHKIVLKGKTYAKIFTDKDRVAQVLTNFCTNAIKYSPKEGKIIIELKKDKGNAIVSVIDFGIGIPKEHHHGIFKKFYRVYGSGNEGYPGLGMGLYISYQIIKLLNGNMWFESTPEKKGSTFYFSVPLA
jgi:PAS domain S-box-containing protein